MRHTRLATTMEVYMQSLEPEVRKAINSIHDELVSTGTEGGPTEQTPVAVSRPRQTVDANIHAPSAKKPVSASEGEMERAGRPPLGRLLQFAGKMRASDLGGVS